jgi:hypothetical protein
MTYISNRGTVDSGNSSTTPLNAGNTFTGTSTNIKAYSSIVVNCFTDYAGALYVDFSSDGTNWDRTISYDVAASTSEAHRVTVIAEYYRVRFTNTSVSNQTLFRLQSLLGTAFPLTTKMSGTITTDQDTLITRSVLTGETDGGSFKNVPVTSEGHLEVEVHGPRLPFGSIHTESLTPIFQFDALYGINEDLASSGVNGSGWSYTSGQVFTCQTGAQIYSQATLQSRKRLRYRPGQGVIGRFTALYSSPAQYGYQLAGFGTAEAGVYFGYGNTNNLTDTRFGILYVTDGVREVRALTISTGATVSGNVTITLNTIPYTVPVTNASNVNRTAYEIATYTSYRGWTTHIEGAIVYFTSDSAGAKAGTFSFSAGATGSAAAFTTTLTGVSSVDTFIPQDEWNGDVMDGSSSESNPCGALLNPLTGNVFQIDIQYLGFGAITFKIENAPNDGNNADFITVHTLRYPNAYGKPSFSQPSFPYTLAVYSAGSTSNLIVQSASVAGMIEGSKTLHGPRFSYYNQLTTVGFTNYQVLMTLHNARYWKGRNNQSVVNIISVSSALKHTSPCIIYLARNATLAGNPNFIQTGSTSSTLYDYSATTCTFTTSQIIWSGHLGDTGEIDHHFGNGNFNAEETTLQPGEFITLCAKAVAGTPSYVTGSINIREDH